MASPTPVYPSAPGPFWLPALTPESSPLNVDEPRNEVTFPEEQRNFSSPPQARPPPGPLLEVQKLQKLGMDFLRDFPSTASESGSPMSTISDGNCAPSTSGEGRESHPDRFAQWRRFSSPPDASGHVPLVTEAEVKESTPSEDDDCTSSALDEQRNKWRRLSTPIEEDQERNQWRRLSTPVEEPGHLSEPGNSAHSLAVLDEQRNNWRRLSTPEEDREPMSGTTEISPSRLASPEDIMEILSSPPMARCPFSVIPCRIAAEIQLPFRGSALDLALLPVMPPKLCDHSCCDPVLLESTPLYREDNELMELLNTIPCPSTQILERIANRESRANTIRSFTVRHPGSETNLPSWVLTFWLSVGTYWRDIVAWKRAHYKLTHEFECKEVLDLFSFIPWDLRFPIPGADVRDLATFTTTEWLSDNHINLLAWFVNTEIESDTLSVIQAAYPQRMSDLFNDWKTDTAPARRNDWLDALRNKLQDGTYRKIGFCIHTIGGGGLPIRPEVGNHWVSVVIDGKNRKIWFGDSMGFPPHKSIIAMLTWWLRPAFKADFSVHHLQCHKQATLWSCGDRAINMIAHHFDPETFPLVGPTEIDERNNRLSLFYNIVHRLRRMPDSNFFVRT